MLYAICTERILERQQKPSKLQYYLFHKLDFIMQNRVNNSSVCVFWFFIIRIPAFIKREKFNSVQRVINHFFFILIAHSVPVWVSQRLHCFCILERSYSMYKELNRRMMMHLTYSTRKEYQHIHLLHWHLTAEQWIQAKTNVIRFRIWPVLSQIKSYVSRSIYAICATPNYGKFSSLKVLAHFTSMQRGHTYSE